MKNKIYFENLDGLRSIAALSVVCYHIALRIPDKSSFDYYIKKIISFSGTTGELGVIFFFILSGFIISYLLFNEKEVNGKINIFKFYIRRSLRIWPLYYFTLIIGFVIYPLYDPEVTINASPIYFSLFLANFDQIYHGDPGIAILGVHWSLAVEEQFYLLWPLIFLFKKKKIKLILIVTSVVLSGLFYYKYSSNLIIGYFHFFSCIRYLGFGAIIAFISYYKMNWIVWMFSKLSKLTTFAIYATCISILFFHVQLSPNVIFNYLLELLPFAFFSFVILDQNFNDRSFFKMRNFRLLTQMGKISYSIYLTHMIAIYLVNQLFLWHGDFFLLKSIITIILTIMISFLSYKFIEAPFIKKKIKYNSMKVLT